VSPTAQALQAVAAVEQLLQTKMQPPELKEVVGEALGRIRDSATSLENVEEVFSDVTKKIYHSLIL